MALNICESQINVWSWTPLKHLWILSKTSLSSKYLLLISLFMPLVLLGVSDNIPDQGERSGLLSYFLSVSFTPYIHFFLGHPRALIQMFSKCMCVPLLVHANQTPEPLNSLILDVALDKCCPHHLPDYFTSHLIPPCLFFFLNHFY